MSTDMTVQLSEADYYKLKARTLEIALQETQIEQLSELVKWKRHVAYTDAGLNPAKSYSLNDKDFSAQEKVPVKDVTLDGTGK